MRRSPTPAAGYLGLRPGGNRPLGIVVPRSLGTLQRFPFCALIRAGRKRKRGMGIAAALRRLNYNSPQAVQGAVGRPVIPALPSLSLEARPPSGGVGGTGLRPLTAAFETVSVFNAGRSRRSAALCPKDRREASAPGDVSIAVLLNDFDFTRRGGRDFIITISNFAPYSRPCPSLMAHHSHSNS